MNASSDNRKSRAPAVKLAKRRAARLTAQLARLKAAPAPAEDKILVECLPFPLAHARPEWRDLIEELAGAIIVTVRGHARRPECCLGCQRPVDQLGFGPLAAVLLEDLNAQPRDARLVGPICEACRQGGLVGAIREAAGLGPEDHTFTVVHSAGAA